MELLNNGFYFVYCCNLVDVLLSLPGCEKRDSLPFPPRVLRYLRFRADELVGWCNEFGTVILFQPLEDVSDFTRALSLYRDPTNEDYYRLRRDKALYAINNVFNKCLNDFDVVFLVNLAPGEVQNKDGRTGDAEIEWEWSKLDNSEPFRVQTLLEACFIFQLCKQVDAECDVLVRSGLREMDWLVLREHASSLYSVEQPERFLFSNREMMLMDLFYEKWGLTESVRALKDRLSGTISLFQFYDGMVSKRREGLMNVLLAAIAILSVLQVRNEVEEVAPSLKSIGFSTWLVAGAAAFLLVGGSLYLLNAIVRWFFRQRLRAQTQRSFRFLLRPNTRNHSYHW